jgi:diphthamide synthase subunit DPH2
MASSDETVTLNVTQSMALRRLIDALKADDSLFTACPKAIRDAFCDFYMPPYLTAEAHIKAVEAESESRMKLIDKFAAQIVALETELGRRKPPVPAILPPPPY